MSFGWSAGDIVAAIKLTHQVITSVQSIGGARDSFQELVGELHGLGRALNEIADLATSSPYVPEILALKFASCTCGGALERFFERIRPFDASLGTDTKSRLKAAPRMVRWELLIKKDIPELRTCLAAHVGYINMRLGTIILKQISKRPDVGAERRSMDDGTTASLEKLNAEALLLRDVVNLIPKRDTSPSIESLLTITTNIWRANNEMIDMLKSMERLTLPPDLRFTYIQAPIRFEDALGRVFPIPSEYDWDKVDAIIQAQFSRGVGSGKVRSREYELYDTSDKSTPLAIGRLDRLNPGTAITMTIIIGQYNGSAKCPRTGCGSHKAGISGVLPSNTNTNLLFTMCRWCGAWFRKSRKPLPMPLKQEHRPTSSSSQQPRNERRSYKNISIYVTDLPRTPARFSSSFELSRNSCVSAVNYRSVLQRPAKGFSGFSSATSYKRKLDAEIYDEKSPRRKLPRTDSLQASTRADIVSEKSAETYV